MNTLPTRRALAAAFVCSVVAPVSAAFAGSPVFAPATLSAAASFFRAPATIVIQESTLEESYQKEEVPFKEWMWLRGGFFAGGGFLTGFFALRLMRRRSPRKLWLMPAGVLFLAMGAPAARACMNIEEDTLEETYRDYTDTGWFTGTVRNALRADPAKDPHLKPNPSAYKTPPPPGALESDEAARMMIRGDAAGALVRLKEIEAAHPGLYQTAANMGTAYELTGDDVQALHWIKTGIQRNPQSHMNAEWLHVKILEAKIELKKDPKWLDSHTITGFSQKEALFVTLQGSKTSWEVMESMRSQATVRALFIKPPDVILAHLLEEASLFARFTNPGSVPGLLDLAEEYGLSKTRADELRVEFETRREAAIRMSHGDPFQKWLWASWPWVLFGLFAIVGGWAGARWSGRKRHA